MEENDTRNQLILRFVGSQRQSHCAAAWLRRRLPSRWWRVREVAGGPGVHRGRWCAQWPGSWPRFLKVGLLCIESLRQTPKSPARCPKGPPFPGPFPSVSWGAPAARAGPGRPHSMHVRVHIVRRVRVPTRMWHGVFVQLQLQVCGRACHWQSRSRCICGCVLATTQLEDDPNPSLRLVNRGLSPGFVPH